MVTVKYGQSVKLHNHGKITSVMDQVYSASTPAGTKQDRYRENRNQPHIN